LQEKISAPEYFGKPSGTRSLKSCQRDSSSTIVKQEQGEEKKKRKPEAKKWGRRRSTLRGLNSGRKLQADEKTKRGDFRQVHPEDIRGE